MAATMNWQAVDARQLLERDDSSPLSAGDLSPYLFRMRSAAFTPLHHSDIQRASIYRTALDLPR